MVKTQPTQSEYTFTNGWWVALAVLALMVAGPFLLTIAGDGQVHLAIAENFARGRPFQYNPNGEIVVASTSPFWTLMLTGFYRMAGDYAPLLLKIAVVAIWLGAAYLLARNARELWRFEGWLLWGTLALWLAHTTIVANALSGLENVLSALQLLWLAWLTARYREGLTPARSVALGLLLGWAILTRPDGGLFALVIVGLLALTLLLRVRQNDGHYAPLLLQLLLIGVVAVLLLLPWYAYQFSVTGRLVTDSSLARLYNGRLGSVMLIPDRLYFHPKAILSLGSAFLPLALGALVTLGDWLRQISAWPTAQTSLLSSTSTLYARTMALALLATGLLFYSFVVGAEAFGRYFLPLYPFFFLAGLEGLQSAYRSVAARRHTLAQVVVLLALIFMVGTSLVDLARRVGPGRFTVNQVLDVVYGPAHRQYLSFNLPGLVAAPQQRAAETAALLNGLGLDPNQQAKIGVTEVQLRYFLDERVEVLSLDGRTSATIQNYIDPTTGVPDFARYFEDTRPDFIHVNQWCAVGGWLASLFTSEIETNLVCRWQEQTAGMAFGDSFTWQGHTVRLVAPEIVQIVWADA